MKYKLIILFLISGLAWSCEDYLSEKPSINLVIPSELDDFQALLDARLRGMNYSPSVGLLSSDDVYLAPGILNRLQSHQVSGYFWETDYYLPDESDPNWYFPYQKIFYANVVLEGLESFQVTSPAEEARVEELKGAAKFYRALGHFEVLTYFAPQFDADQINQLGIPIRLSADINLKTQRATQAQTYQQIFDDLRDALAFLPDRPSIPTRPSQWAVHALLSRIYMVRQNYGQALSHAESALGIGDELMNYNLLEEGLPYSFEIFNPEVIFYSELLSGRYATNANTYVNPDLVELYEVGDLRIPFFFRTAAVDTLYNMRGHYTGDFYPFGGLATDEVWLDFIEAATRIGEVYRAKLRLDEFRKNRVSTEKFTPFGGSDQELLETILVERRKELVFRGTRWLDLKRLNTDQRWQVTLRRFYNVEGGELPPNDLRYVIPIPPDEMGLNPMQQNPR